jgi:hypothetical protein
MICRHHRHGKTYSLLGGGGDIPHPQLDFSKSVTPNPIAKTSWIDFHRLRYDAANAVWVVAKTSSSFFGCPVLG